MIYDNWLECVFQYYSCPKHQQHNIFHLLLTSIILYSIPEWKRGTDVQRS